MCGWKALGRQKTLLPVKALWLPVAPNKTLTPCSILCFTSCCWSWNVKCVLSNIYPLREAVMYKCSTKKKKKKKPHTLQVDLGVEALLRNIKGILTSHIRSWWVKCWSWKSFLACTVIFTFLDQNDGTAISRNQTPFEAWIQTHTKNKLNVLLICFLRSRFCFC